MQWQNRHVNRAGVMKRKEGGAAARFYRYVLRLKGVKRVSVS